MKNQRFLVRLGFALSGIRHAFRSEASFRFQCGAAVALVVLLAVLRPPAVWCAILLVNAALVLAAELFNTALEHVIDRLHPEKHPAIAAAKDCAAGAVLIFSTTSLLVFLAFIRSYY
jgi:diacylglycerol kinase (ATP)